MTKSILKNPSVPQFSMGSYTYVPVPHSRLRSDRNLDLATEHANLIQQRKDAANLIFRSIEILLDYPPSQSSDPANPTLEFAEQITSLLQPFQPADYDSLIVERNIDGKCGYVLCPRPNKVEETTARFRVVRARGYDIPGTGLRVLDKAALEKWCSEACGKRALYLKVQLSEVPAWERAATSESALHVLREESVTQLRDGDFQRAKDVQVLEEGLKSLAIERGVKYSDDSVPDVIDVSIREHETMGETPEPPMQDTERPKPGEFYGEIEGYTPALRKGKVGLKSLQDTLQEKDDVMDTI